MGHNEVNRAKPVQAAALLIMCGLVSAGTSLAVAAAFVIFASPLHSVVARVAEIDRRVTAMGDVISTLTVSMAGLHIELDDLRMAVDQEREDRLDAERLPTLPPPVRIDHAAHLATDRGSPASPLRLRREIV
jgi:hypothetical protein